MSQAPNNLAACIWLLADVLRGDIKQSNNVGAAYVMTKMPNGVWEPYLLRAANGVLGDGFGVIVAVTDLPGATQGTVVGRILVGAADEKNLGTKAGAAYFF